MITICYVNFPFSKAGPGFRFAVVAPSYETLLEIGLGDSSLVEAIRVS